MKPTSNADTKPYWVRSQLPNCLKCEGWSRGSGACETDVLLTVICVILLKVLASYVLARLWSYGGAKIPTARQHAQDIQGRRCRYKWVVIL